MIIKDRFKLVSNAENILQVSESVIQRYIGEENTVRHVFAILELKKSSISHFTKNKIFDWISNTVRRESIKVVSFDNYPLPVSYNHSTKSHIINLKYFNVSNVASLNPNDLFASLVYAYTFTSLVTKEYKIQESYAKTIVNYLLSFYLQLFGKEYGLIGSYSTGIPKLKFLIACYILSSFFGVSSGKTLFQKASTIAPYLYEEDIKELFKYDFSQIDQFILAVSDLKVMPGLTIIKYTSKLYRFFGVNILPAMEDCSRFFSVMLTSSISGNSIAPKFLFKYNQKEYSTLIEILRRLF